MRRLLLLAALPLAVFAADDSETEVTRLDGSKVVGKVEMPDPYTLRITSDTGILKIPIALLGQADFRKFGLSTDRSKDGRLWSERKDALEDEKKTEKEDSPRGEAIELQLKEIAPLQPLIAAYQATLPAPGADKAGGNSEKSTPFGNGPPAPAMDLFSGGGLGGVPGVPAGIPGMGAAGAAASTATQAAPLPVVPLP